MHWSGVWEFWWDPSVGRRNGASIGSGALGGAERQRRVAEEIAG